MDFRVFSRDFKRLLGGSACSLEVQDYRDSKHAEGAQIGPPLKPGVTRPSDCELVLAVSEDETAPSFVWRCKREGVPFSELEEEYCNQAIAALGILARGFQAKGHSAHWRTAAITSAFDIATARFLRRQRTGRFGAIQNALQTLKLLTFQTYEGRQATSGMLFGSNKRVVMEKLRNDCELEPRMIVDDAPFMPGTGTLFLPGFYDNAMSYRMVSGLNEWYLTDQQGRVFATLVAREPGKYDAIDRSNLILLQDAAKAVGAEPAFGAVANTSGEVQVVTQQGSQFVWTKGNWLIWDPNILDYFFKGAGVKTDERRLVNSIVFGLSRMRIGTVILFSDSPSVRKLIKGRVAEGTVSEYLAARHIGQHLDELVQQREIIGLLSSDGLAHFGLDGTLRGVGLIVNTEYADSSVRGGGRTAAASAASHEKFEGHVVKVSQDGAVDLFHGGRSVYRFG